jgi:outer membrane biosynthesis protein TonB
MNSFFTVLLLVACLSSTASSFTIPVSFSLAKKPSSLQIIASRNNIFHGERKSKLFSAEPAAAAAAEVAPPPAPAPAVEAEAAPPKEEKKEAKEAAAPKEKEEAKEAAAPKEKEEAAPKPPAKEEEEPGRPRFEWDIIGTKDSKSPFAKEIGVQAPLHFFDPMEFLDGADQNRFDVIRGIELKHGRIAMLAV